MSFFNIKEAIEEYIEEYTLQSDIAKDDFGYEIFINDNNKLIIKLLYDRFTNPEDMDDNDFTKELELLNYDYEVILSHYDEEALNEFLDDTLLIQLPKATYDPDNPENKYMLFIRKEYRLCNGKLFMPRPKIVNSIMPSHSHANSFYTSSNISDAIVSSFLTPTIPLRDPILIGDKLEFNVYKNRPKQVSHGTINFQLDSDSNHWEDFANLMKTYSIQKP